jgi:hypothetical protein
MKKSQLFLVIIFIGSLSFAEAQTLDYTTVNYSTSLCNVFNVNPARVVNGLTHYPVSGGVSYNGAALVLQTKGGTTPSTTLGTAYAIAFTIKQGYIYNISVNTNKSSQDPVSAPIFEIGAISSLPNPNNTDPTACGAVDQNKWGTLQSSVIGFAYINNTAAQNYNIVQSYTATSNLSYFTILAHSGSQTHSSSVLINSITITESTPELVLTPTTLNLSCGTTTTQTFTVSNPNNVQNITSYEWNLGSSNNGWEYNGSAAQQNISTTSNSINLTPSCGVALSNVIVTVRVLSQDYKTYTCTLNVSSPSMSINGSLAFCTGNQNYTINNLPCNASVVWEVTPSGIASPSCTSCNSTTLTQTGNGIITLKATITACGNNTVITENIQIGHPVVTAIIGMTHTGTILGGITLNLSVAESATSYSWSVAGGTIQGSSTGQSVSVKVNNCNPDYLQFIYFNADVTLQNSCGTGDLYGEWVYAECTDLGEPERSNPHNPKITDAAIINLSIFPNPAKNTLYVTIPNTKLSRPVITIYDIYGKQMIKLTSPSQINVINISNWAQGTYIVKIDDGKKTTIRKIIKE